MIEIPVELATLLDDNPAAREAFEFLSCSHRREHALHMAEAKKPETRERRASQTVEALIGSDTRSQPLKRLFWRGGKGDSPDSARGLG